MKAMIRQTRKRSVIFALLSIAVIALAGSTVFFGLKSGQVITTAQLPGITSARSGSIAIGLPSSGNLLASPGTSSSLQSNTITTTGTGLVSYTPNEAIISVGVITFNATAEGATNSNALKTERVILALNSIGIPNSSLQTEGFNLNINFANTYGNAPPQLSGFTVTNTLQVNITGLAPKVLGSEIGLVIDQSVKAGANQVSFQFTTSNALFNQLEKQALQQAVLSASSQAHTIATSLGVNITGVVSATEGYPYSPQPYSGLTFAAAVTSTPIIPGTQTTSVTVTVTYSIG